jgi:SAM-dependent methyltransferase
MQLTVASDDRQVTRVADRSRADTDRLKATFDTVADSYHQVRPDYPAELFAVLVARAGLAPAARLLEVGCGTGKATLPLAQLGFRITCLEPGPHLAAAARRNLAGYDVEVVERAFEDWTPPRAERFDLIFSATAWHWIDPAVGYQLAWRWLRPGGQLAIWSADHVFPAAGDPFFRELQPVYDEIHQGVPPGSGGFFAPGEQPDERAVIEASGLFDVTVIQHFDWELRYSAEDYIALIGTFSSHIDMTDWQRDRLYGEIRRRLAARPDGMVRRHWGAVLHLATRREQPDARLAGDHRTRRSG